MQRRAPTATREFRRESGEIPGLLAGWQVLPQTLKHRPTVLVYHHDLAIDHARLAAELADCSRDIRIAVLPLIAVAGDEPHAAGIATGDQAKTVVLDLVQPASAGWWPVGLSWNARLEREDGGRGTQHLEKLCTGGLEIN